MSGAWLDDDVPDRSRLVAVPNGRVFVCDVGPGTHASAGTPIVMLHGLFVTHHVFSRVIPALARTRRVLALDLPGCGDSDRPAAAVADGYSINWLTHVVSQTIAMADVQRFDIVAHDYSGAVALALAARFPQQVGRMVLSAPLVLTAAIPGEGLAPWLAASGPEIFSRTFRKADLRRFLATGMSTPELVDETELSVYWDRLCRPGGLASVYAMLDHLPRVIRGWDVVRDIAARTQVLWGDQDQIVPVAHGEKLVAALPSAELVVLDGCGHSPATERPAAFLEQIRSHLGA